MIYTNKLLICTFVLFLTKYIQKQVIQDMCKMFNYYYYLREID